MGTRATRAHTASSVIRKDLQVALGEGDSPESRSRAIFKRTYSSNSIKTRSVSASHFFIRDAMSRFGADTAQVEVTASSFQKIKLLGKGDVGKVYLVKEKKTEKLFAMKGGSLHKRLMDCAECPRSVEQEGNDQAEQDQAGSGGTRDPSDCQSPIHRYAVSLVPIARLLVLRARRESPYLHLPTAPSMRISLRALLASVCVFVTIALTRCSIVWAASFSVRSRLDLANA